MYRPLICLCVALTAVAACNRPRSVGASSTASPARDAPPALPGELAGFTASAPQAGPGFVRRTYTQQTIHVDVTLARAPLPPGGFDSWLSMSRAGYPQAALDAPADDANGFYQCAETPRPSCDLLIQLRSGVHLELRGGGSSSRANVDALAHALPLRAWSRLESSNPRVDDRRSGR